MKRRFRIENLDCPGCAAKIEDMMRDMPGVSSASINLASGVLTLEGGNDVAIDSLRKIMRSVEPDTDISPFNERAGGHDGHAEDHSRREIASLTIAAVVYAVALWRGERFLYAAAYVLAAYPVLISSGKTLFSRNFLNEFFLMSFASLAAIAIDKFPEAVSVMLFYRIGEFLQERAVAKSRRQIRSLAAEKPSTARVRRGEAEELLTPELVKKGDVVIVRPGEKIPVDGRVLDGSSTVDASSLTGESVPVSVAAGTSVYGGSLNLEGLIIVESSGDYEDSTVARIMDMVENAVERKSKTERFITTFSRYYTPAVVGAAAIVALAPPLLGLGAFDDWLYRALVLLVISCPCALVISVPLGYFGGIGASSRRGILVKGGNIFDAVHGVKKVFFDKTGTLTKGVFAVTETNPSKDATEEELARAAAIAEGISNHPIARSITAAFASYIPRGMSVAHGDEIQGGGVAAKVAENGREFEILAGSARMMSERGIPVPDETSRSGAVVHVASDGRYLGNIVVSDELRHESPEAVRSIRTEGISEVYMLTGDRASVAAEVSGALGLTDYRAELMPDGKVAAISELSGGELSSCMFVGDGANDGPVLASVGVGVAMGGLGSEIAVEVADTVILDDSPAKVADLIRIARFTRKVVWQNITASMAIKLAFMGLGVLGVANLWEAIFADVGVAILAVLNASRTFRI